MLSSSLPSPNPTLPLAFDFSLFNSVVLPSLIELSLPLPCLSLAIGSLLLKCTQIFIVEIGKCKCKIAFIVNEEKLETVDKGPRILKVMPVLEKKDDAFLTPTNGYLQHSSKRTDPPTSSSLSSSSSPRPLPSLKPSPDAHEACSKPDLPSMARKRSPIVRKALGLIAAGLSPVARARRPIARKLLLLRRTQRSIYGYAYVAEYEFSPPKKRSRRFLSLLCGGDGEESVLGDGDELEALAPDENAGADLEMLFEEEEEEEEEGDASVDQRAERFIEKFYEGIRIQRQESEMGV
ncbi:hypothetical protein ZIOFF_066739 [Zingiber officinale]|uniref:Uncharacterized protein n=1 Tax=Zingiber officinale TaxID=94328 RepID=A0A8J5EYL5_ZINOF|nr:hypothetical protein ZIOFF_066739 [Zingiber officinale]